MANEIERNMNILTENLFLSDKTKYILDKAAYLVTHPEIKSIIIPKEKINTKKDLVISISNKDMPFFAATSVFFKYYIILNKKYLQNFETDPIFFISVFLHELSHLFAFDKSNNKNFSFIYNIFLRLKKRNLNVINYLIKKYIHKINSPIFQDFQKDEFTYENEKLPYLYSFLVEVVTFFKTKEKFEVAMKKYMANEFVFVPEAFHLYVNIIYREKGKKEVKKFIYFLLKNFEKGKILLKNLVNFIYNRLKEYHQHPSKKEELEQYKHFIDTDIF